MRADARARDELARLLEFKKQRAVCVILQVYYFSRSSETCRSRYRYKIVKVKIIPQSPFNWTCRVASRSPNFCGACNLFFDERNNTMNRRVLSDEISGGHGIPPNNHFADRHCYGAVIRGASQWHPKNARCTVA